METEKIINVVILDSSEETAKILNLPVGTVLSRLARAQKILKEFIKPNS